MTRQEAINHLIVVAENEVARYGYMFSTEAKPHLREFVTTGVDTMIRTGQFDPDHITIAVHNMQRFCQFICEKKNRENRIVENREFSNARGSICPLWPFC